MFTDDQIQEARFDLALGSTGWVVFSLHNYLVSILHSCQIFEKHFHTMNCLLFMSPAAEENIAITKELFLLVIQDRGVQAVENISYVCTGCPICCNQF